MVPGKISRSLLVLIFGFIFITSCKEEKDTPASEPDPVVTPVITTDFSVTEQTIRGFGGATVFVPTQPLTTVELDKLFGNGAGQIGLTLLRIRVASDDDPNWRALELANAVGAKARGAEVIASPWSPPVRMKSNNSLIGGSLKTESYADFATYLNNFATYMDTNGGGLYGISIQNEPDVTVTYESCDWTASQMRDFLKNNGAIITATRVIAPESFHFDHNFSNTILDDDDAAANTDIIGGHIYGGGLVDYPEARDAGKEVWMTEHLDTDTTWTALLATAKEIHDCLAVANFNAYIWWYAKRFYGPLGETNIVTKRGYIMSNFSKYVRPGAVRVMTEAAGTTSVLVSAYQNSGFGVIVAVNMNNFPAEQSFVMQNTPISAVLPHTTARHKNLVEGESIPVVGGEFTAILPSQSVTTFVGGTE